MRGSAYKCRRNSVWLGVRFFCQMLHPSPARAAKSCNSVATIPPKESTHAGARELDESERSWRERNGGQAAKEFTKQDQIEFFHVLLQILQLRELHGAPRELSELSASSAREDERPRALHTRAPRAPRPARLRVGARKSRFPSGSRSVPERFPRRFPRRFPTHLCGRSYSYHQQRKKALHALIF